MVGKTAPGPHRLFVAVELPAEARSALAAWREDLPGLGWVREEQIHLTLRFIGAVPEEARARFEGVVRGWEFSPFEVAFAGAGAFPAGDAPEVVWVGVAEGGGRLAGLREQIDARLQGEGLPRDARVFHPHVTLARVRDPRAQGAARGWVRRHAGEAGPRVRVAGATLFRTHFGSGRAEHEAIARSGGGRG